MNNKKEKLKKEKLKKINKHNKPYRDSFLKTNYRAFTIRFNKVKDADVIAFLEECPNAVDYIRQSVRRCNNKHLRLFR